MIAASRPFRTYADVRHFLNGVTNYEREAHVGYNRSNYNLDTLRDLLHAVGDPHRQFRSIHIAGTKGKGSTATMTEKILREAGFKTGLYTSPHLIDMLERIRIDGENIGERNFTTAAEIFRSAMNSRRTIPTFFDIMTAIAFIAFARAKVEYAVVEVGMGGRLDSTNVITPIVSTIMPIDYDHTDKLGKTIAKIAREKCGIVKAGVPVVAAPQRPSAMKIIKETCRALRAPLYAFGTDIRVERLSPSRQNRNMLQYSVRTPWHNLKRISLPLLGEHQRENSATACAIAGVVGGISEGAIGRALRTVRIPGRIELISTKPSVIVDSAHNPLSIEALLQTLSAQLKYRRLILVFGVLADKDVRTMLKPLLKASDVAIFTEVPSRRSMSALQLSALAEKLGDIPVMTAGAIDQALRLARIVARRDDAIVVTGSFYLAGEALRIMGTSR